MAIKTQTIAENINQDNLLRFAQAARDAGVPRDQLESFIAGAYIPLPKQLQFHAIARQADDLDGPFWILFGGARGPGKSHSVLAQAGLDDCQRFPGLRWLYLRKIQKAAGESLTGLVSKIFRNTEHDYAESKGQLTFPNGSNITIGGYKDPRDIDKYVGISYDGYIIEELTQLDQERVTLIRGSLRSDIPDWRPRVYCSTNPGGVGHAFVKQVWIGPHRMNKPGLFIGGKTAFIPSTYRDNPFLDAEYIKYLEALPGQLGQAWRDGDWDVFAGMAFPKFRYETHVIPPMLIPEHWPKIRAIDWGSSAPFCCLWGAVEPDTNRVVIYREIYLAGLTDKEQAQSIGLLTPDTEKISITYADPSVFAKKNYKGIWTSTADEYLSYGIPLTAANNDRIQGKRTVDRYLGNLPDGRPGLVFTENCENVIRTFPNLPLDPNRVEDVDTDAEDHAYDALRYLLSKQVVAHKKSEDEALNQKRSPIATLERM